MTATTVKSAKLTAELVTAPPAMQLAGASGGAATRVLIDTIEAATTSLDEANDTILFAALPSNAVVHSITLFNDDLDSGGTAGAVDVGVYNGERVFVDGSTTYAAYAVIDQDAFASAITTLTAANTAGVEVSSESNAGAGDLANKGKRLWDALGLAADPVKLFTIGVTVTTAMTTPVAGTITLVVRYSI